MGKQTCVKAFLCFIKCKMYLRNVRAKFKYIAKIKHRNNRHNVSLVHFCKDYIYIYAHICLKTNFKQVCQCGVFVCVCGVV